MTELPSMTNFDIMEILGKYPEFEWVGSKDLVNSKNCVDGKLYVLNLDSHDGGGTHWVLLSLVDKDYNMYYDSYSAYPAMSVEKFLQKQHKNTMANPKYEAEQQLTTVTCGYFVCFIALLQLKMKYSVQECLDFFRDDTEWNEKVITEFGKEVVKKLKG
jgi:hypothetical protein